MSVASLDDLDWPVRTERLLLRRATRDDLDAVHRIRSLPGVSDWLTTAADDRDAFLEAYGAAARLAGMVIVELDGEVVGDLMLAVQDSWAQTEVRELAAGRQVELGWVIDPAVQGRGLATEAARALLALAFDHLGAHRVTASCFAANEASWRMMERLGMRRESAGRRDGLHRSGEWMDGLEYALLADEWAERVGPPGAG